MAAFMRRSPAFRDRKEAGRMLAKELAFLKGVSGAIILAIPRGGVPVAYEVAERTGSALDIIVTRKIGAPGDPEFAIGAVGQDGEVIIDPGVSESLSVPERYVEEESARQAEEVRARMRKYRGERPYPDLHGRTVVIVDDGIATGYTMRAAAASAKRMGASRVVLAAPVGAPDSVAELWKHADQVVCPFMPPGFAAIGEFYEDFTQVEDDEVRRLLDLHEPDAATSL